MTATVVVFDVDDTLYLERDYVRSGFQAVGALVRRRFGVGDFAERAWDAFLAGRRRTIFDQTLIGSGLPADPEVVGELIECYRGHEPSIALLPDARAALEQCSPVAVVTDGPVASQRAKVVALGLARWAEPIVLTEEMGPEWAKPSPRPFALVEEALGVAGPACVYVADNPAKDFAGPRARRWRTVRVRRPLSLHVDVDGDGDGDVDLEIPDLACLSDVLATMTGE